MRPGALPIALLVAAATACGKGAASEAPEEAPEVESAPAPALALAPAPKAPDRDAMGACGAKGEPACPLRVWMKANAGPAVRARDFDALAEALDRIATFAPAGYTNWASIARDGASAARAQSLDAVKASCRSCHDQYKDRYKRELRARPIL